MKNSKQKLVFTTVIIIALLSAYASAVPNVHASEMTTAEKSVSILNDVAGFNMTAYTPSLRSDESRQFLSSPQEEADFTLMSSTGKLRVRCSFVGDHLHQIFVSDLSGTPSLNQPSVDALGSAKGFLERYESYTSNVFYGDLKSMLDDVNVGENVTKTVGNVNLRVSVVNQAFVDFMWTYVDENGVPAMSKDVVLSYRNGFLKSFLDNWQLYRVAGEPELSCEEAVAIALNASEGFSWEVVDAVNGSVMVSGFEIVAIGDATLSYLNYRDESTARGGDPFALYSSWYVPLGFDKVYPGCVTGVTVRVWADTGEVSGVSPMVSGGAASNEPVEPLNGESSLLLLGLLVVAVAVGAVGVSSVRETGKTRSSKICGVSLVLLISFSSMLVAAPKANAVPADQDAKSMIYASTYGQLQDEVDAAEEVCDSIEANFSDAGYDTTNAFGASTTKQYVLDNASSMEVNYDFVALFHFGHGGATWNPIYDLWQDFNYYDNTGDKIYYYDIENETGGKHFFVFIWVCWQGQYPWGGMPVAWTQRDDLSDDGYYEPDGPHCFIGFEDASPALSSDSFKDCQVLGKDVIMDFYYYALDESYSVNDALDWTSLELFSTVFGSSPLYEGYETWWPYNPTFPDHGQGWETGRMCVYGNGNIYLAKEYEVTVLAKDQYGNNLGSCDVYIDDELVGTTGSSFNVTQATHSFQVSAPFGYALQNYTYDGGYSTENPMTLNVSSDMTVTAYFEEAYHWLTVYAYDYGFETQLPVGVTIDSGEWSGTAGDSFYVPEGYHTVEVDDDISYQGQYYWFYFFGGYPYEQNGVYVLVDSATELYAVYLY